MRRAVLVLVLTLGVAAPSVARADAAEQARFHDALARRYFEQARRTGRDRFLELALREFFLEQRVAPNPRIVFNIAMCFRLLGRRPQAFHYYEEYLAGRDDDEERQRRATEALEELRPRLALVEVTSEPSGATIYVDRVELGSWGQTPRTIALEPGEHRLLLRRPGYRQGEVTVEAAGGQQVSTSATLEQVVSQLTVRAPEGATVEVRDTTGATAAAGDAPLEASIPPGDYSVTIESRRHRRWTELVRLEADQARVLEPALEALPAPSTQLTVTSTTLGATVLIDGEPMGFTPLVLPRVEEGEHLVRVRAEDHSPWEGRLRLSADDQAWLSVELAEPETTRSPFTWVLGGIGAAALVAGAGFGAWALDRRIAFDNGSPTRPATGVAVVADALFTFGVVHGLIALWLYFSTEQRSPGASEAAFSGGLTE